jgi:hypothetical protein
MRGRSLALADDCFACFSPLLLARENRSSFLHGVARWLREKIRDSDGHFDACATGRSGSVAIAKCAGRGAR